MYYSIFNSGPEGLVLVIPASLFNPTRRLKAWGSGLLSNQGEKSINLYFKEKSIKVWYSKAQG